MYPRRFPEWRRVTTCHQCGGHFRTNPRKPHRHCDDCRGYACIYVGNRLTRRGLDLVGRP